MNLEEPRCAVPQFQLISYTLMSDSGRFLPYGLERDVSSWYDTSKDASGFMMWRVDFRGDGSELGLSGRRSLSFKQVLWEN